MDVRTAVLVPPPPRPFFDPSAVTAQNIEKYKIETYRQTKTLKQ